jgi:hypothetical protein
VVRDGVELKGWRWYRPKVKFASHGHDRSSRKILRWRNSAV